LDLSFDRENNLYVLDARNNRVQKFDVNWRKTRWKDKLKEKEFDFIGKS
jgi:hypothetical protein